jgi:metal-dependent amidase/aminoacylase/carboxypeptidase family protein
MNSIIPETVRITGTVRSYTQESRDTMLHHLQQAFEITKMMGGDYDLQVTHGEVVTKNHPVVTKHIKKVYRRLFPYFELLEQPFGLEGEDFGHVTQRVPGAIFFVGAGYETPGQPTKDLHTPNFGIDERCLPVGTAMMAEVALSILKDWKVEEETDSSI